MSKHDQEVFLIGARKREAPKRGLKFDWFEVRGLDACAAKIDELLASGKYLEVGARAFEPGEQPILKAS